MRTAEGLSFWGSRCRLHGSGIPHPEGVLVDGCREPLRRYILARVQWLLRGIHGISKCIFYSHHHGAWGFNISADTSLPMGISWATIPTPGGVSAVMSSAIGAGCFNVRWYSHQGNNHVSWDAFLLASQKKREKWKWKKRLTGLAGAGPGRSFSLCLILLFHNLVVFSRIAFVFYTVHNIGFGFLMRSFVLSLISFVASLFSHFYSTFLDLGVEWFRFLFHCLSFH